MFRRRETLLLRVLLFSLVILLVIMVFSPRSSKGFQKENPTARVLLPLLFSSSGRGANTSIPIASQIVRRTNTPGVTPGSASPVIIAFTADSEALTRWPEVLKLIKNEGAELISVQGDYWGQTKTYVDWVNTLKNNLDSHQSSPYVSKPIVLGPATGAEIGPPLGPHADQLAHDFYNTVTFMEAQLGATWGGCIGNGDKASSVYADKYFRVPPEQCKVTYHGPDQPPSGRAGDYWVKYKGISMVYQNQQGDINWPLDAFAAAAKVPDSNIWKLCMWHGNHLDFNAFSKGHAYNDGPVPDSSLPYGMYKACADAGALVINGNTHQYTRTCVLDNVGNWRSGGANNANNERNRIERDPSRSRANHTTTASNCPGAGKPNAQAHNTEQLTIGPGKTIVFVSSLGGGFEMRDYKADVYQQDQSKYLQDRWRHDQDGWWSTIFAGGRYCRNNCTKGDLSAQDRMHDLSMDDHMDIQGAGALFITFNYQGNPYKAYGYYKTIKGQIIDEFLITYQP